MNLKTELPELGCTVSTIRPCATRPSYNYETCLIWDKSGVFELEDETVERDKTYQNVARYKTEEEATVDHTRWVTWLLGFTEREAEEWREQVVGERE